MTREQLIKEACVVFGCAEKSVKLKRNIFREECVNLYVYGEYKATYRIKG